jgi:hypothetical protein
MVFKHFQKISEALPANLGPPNPARYCSHRTRIADMATWETDTGNRFVHVKSSGPGKKYFQNKNSQGVNVLIFDISSPKKNSDFRLATLPLNV